MESIRDSIETSVAIRVFPSLKDASYSHIFHSDYTTLPIAQFRTMENFNPKRLSSIPYPDDDRPRGQDDLDSVIYHRKRIRKLGQTDPIWVGVKKGKYVLFDGAHRIVAYYLENKRNVPCYIVSI